MVDAARQVFIAAFTLCMFTAGVMAQDASHCDKIKDDDAFNKCLAAASPSRAGSRPATVPLAATPPSSAANAPEADPPSGRASRSSGRRGYGPLQRARESASRSRAYANQWRVQRVSRGRVRMVIPMGRRR